MNSLDTILLLSEIAYSLAWTIVKRFSPTLELHHGYNFN